MSLFKNQMSLLRSYLKTVMIFFIMAFAAVSSADRKAAFDPFQSTNPHLALGVYRNATEEEIKLAYRRAAFKYHPDRARASGLTPEQADTAFKNINKSYKNLLGKTRNPVLDDMVNGVDLSDRKDPVFPSTETEMYKLIRSEFNIFMANKKLEGRVFNDFWQDRFQGTFRKALIENPESTALFKKVWDVWMIENIKNAMDRKIEVSEYSSVPTFSGEANVLAALWVLQSAKTPNLAIKSASRAVLTYFNSQEYDIPKTIAFARQMIVPSLTNAGIKLTGTDGLSVIDFLFMESTLSHAYDGKNFLVLYAMVIEKFPNSNRIERLKAASAHSKDSVIGILYSMAKTLNDQPQFKVKIEEFLYSVDDPAVERSVAEWIQVLKSAAEGPQDTFSESMKRIYAEASSKNILEDGLSKYRFWGNRNFQVASKRFVTENIFDLAKKLPSKIIIRLLNSVADPLFKMPIYSDLARNAKSKQQMLEYLNEGIAIATFELSIKEITMGSMYKERAEYAESVSKLLIEAQKNEEARIGRNLKKLDFLEGLINSTLELYKKGDSSFEDIFKGIPKALAANPSYEGMLILRGLLSRLDRDDHSRVFQDPNGNHYLLKTINEMFQEMQKANVKPSSSRSLVPVGGQCSKIIK